MADTQTSEWIEHDGGGMPVGDDEIVHIRMSCGWCDENMEASEAHFWNWDWPEYPDPSPLDIVQFRVVKP
jgi:hypothetical protein